jgi:uncharacterized FAD-dependent dehydrogenase
MVYDVVIVGAGIAGISSALFLSTSNKINKIALIDAGSIYNNRACPVEENNTCSKCDICNVISGFGGCFRYGDEVKLSMFPSGKRLSQYAVTTSIEDIYMLLNKTIFNSQDFNESSSHFKNIKLKKYPISIVDKSEIKTIIEKLYNQIINNKKIDLYLNEKILKITKDDKTKIFSLYSQKNRIFNSDSVNIAVGRLGRNWWKNEIEKNNIDYTIPTPSVGIRFEMPKEILKIPGIIHPDFKTTIYKNGYKIKTFCFCGGTCGGSVKYTKYDDLISIDGHISTNADNTCGNFALLVSMSQEESNIIIKRYKDLNHGYPILQPYLDFKKKELTKKSFKNISSKLSYYPSNMSFEINDLASLFDDKIHNAFCSTFEELFINFNDSKINIDEVLVTGLEIENSWYTIKTTNNLETSIPGFYVSGDAIGIAQGIMQASYSGYICAMGILSNKANN